MIPDHTKNGRGFLSESKKLARLLSELLRQGEKILFLVSPEDTQLLTYSLTFYFAILGLIILAEQIIIIIFSSNLKILLYDETD